MIEQYKKLLLAIREAERYTDTSENELNFSKETLNRASRFLHSLYNRLLNHKVIMDIPDIAPGPNKTIDLWWDNDRYHLLMNVPKDESKKLTMYGYNKLLDRKLSGPFNENADYSSMFCWLFGEDIK